jgi:hypothetical protein
MLRFNVIMTPIPRTSLARAAWQLDASSRQGAGPLVAENAHNGESLLQCIAFEWRKLSRNLI